jgi:hypothetical protein
VIKKAQGKIALAQNLEVVKHTIEIAGNGFAELAKQAGRVTKSPTGVVETLRRTGIQIKTFEEICTIRSYHLEPVVVRGKIPNLLMALTEGGATGYFGLIGMPFNLALSFFLYFRATQAVALTYGYNVRNDPRELQIASEITLTSLDPILQSQAGGIAEVLVKMMTTAELTALRSALTKKTYQEMAERGGAQLMYVQLRALANRAAKKALDASGQKGLESSMLKSMLEQVSKNMSKQVGAKSIPVLSAVLGAGIDSYFMHRVVEGANLIYHKRFLVEKEKRVAVYRAVSKRNVKRGGSSSKRQSTRDA